MSDSHPGGCSNEYGVESRQMSRPFSPQRLRASFRDATIPVKWAKANWWFIGSLLTLWGSEVLEPHSLLPESTLARVVLLIVLLLPFLGTVQTAYRLRSRIEELEELGLPTSEREQILRLKTVASRATDAFAEIELFRPTPSTSFLLDELREIYGGLRQHRELYHKARNLETALRYCRSMAGTAGDHMVVGSKAVEIFHDLITECDRLLTLQHHRAGNSIQESGAKRRE